MLKLAIVTPTYNEVKNVENLLTSISRVSSDHPNVKFLVTIVDDSSPDGTAELASIVAKKLKSKNFEAQVLVRAKKDGLGKAYIFGFTQILKTQKPDYILQMDADLSHDPTYISGFIHQANEKADFVVASRYASGGGTPDWSWYRKVLSRGGNFYARTVLGRKISDYTGGFNMYSAKLMKSINLGTVEATGYGFLIELKYRSLRKARKVTEIPIVFLDRTHGSSKIPKSTLFKNFILVWKVKFQKF